MDLEGLLIQPQISPVPSCPPLQVTALQGEPLILRRLVFAGAFRELPPLGHTGQFPCLLSPSCPASSLFNLELPHKAAGVGGCFSFCGRDPRSAITGPPPEALSHILSSCRTQGGVHVHEDGLTVTSPVLMWVQVSTGISVPLLSQPILPADLAIC